MRQFGFNLSDTKPGTTLDSNLVQASGISQGTTLTAVDIADALEGVWYQDIASEMERLFTEHKINAD